MYGDRDVIRDSVHDVNIGKTSGERVLQVDQPAGRTKHAYAVVTLRCLIACEWHIARVAERHRVITEHRAVHHLIG